MSKQKLTPWFPISTPPVRKGVYQVSCRTVDQSGRWFAYWNGEFFGWYTRYQNALVFMKDEYIWSDITKSWRGIAK